MTLSKCAVCDAPAPLYCSKCKSVAYCSVPHQALVWKAHKMLCGQDTVRQPALLCLEVDSYAKTKRVRDKDVVGVIHDPSRSGTIEQVLRQEDPNRDPFDEFTKRLSSILNTADGPNDRSAAISRDRHVIFKNRDLNPEPQGTISYYPFYLVADLEFPRAGDDFTTRSLPEPTFTAYNRAVFDYYTMQFFLCSRRRLDLPPAFDLAFHQIAYERMQRVVEEASTSGVREARKLGKRVKELGLELRHYVRMARGMSTKDSRMVMYRETNEVMAEQMAGLTKGFR